MKNRFLLPVQATALVLGLWLLLGGRGALAQLPQPSDFVKPAYVAIVWPNAVAVGAPIGLPPGGNVTLMAIGTEEGTGAPIMSFIWHRNGNPAPFYTGQILSITQAGTYTVEAVGLTSTRVVVVNTEDTDGYILSSTQETLVQKVGVTTSAQVDQLIIGEKQQQTTYYTGLGRVLESVQKQVTPAGQDVYAFQEYDAAGGSPKGYLPFAQFVPNASYRPLATLKTAQAQFYSQTSDPTLATDAMPYSQSVAEASPLYRPQQANRVGTIAAQHLQTVSYQVNSSSDAVLRWTLTTSPANLSSAPYAPGLLSKTVTTDEDGRVVTTFQNELGQTVLQRKISSNTAVAALDTYMLYDDLGRVVCVIPPKAVKQLATNGSSAALFTSLLYQYTYGERGRLSSRRVPGAEPMYFVYDTYDRPVLTQDGNQRQNNAWAFTKYDLQGRAIVDGLYTSNQSQSDLQLAADGWATGSGGEHRLDVDGGGYSLDQTFPAINPNPGGNASVLSRTFYDDYNLTSLASGGGRTYSYQSQGLGMGTEPEPDYEVRGRATVAQERVVQSDGSLGGWLTTVMLYDQYGNVIQKQSNSLLKDGDYELVPNTTTLVYDQGGFQAQVTRSIKRVETDNLGYVVVRNRYAYDRAGRLLRVWQQNEYNTLVEPEVLVARYAYNELGQLIEKNLHSLDNEVSFLQSVDLRYDIQGRLATLNNSELKNDGITNNDDDDVFGFTLTREVVPGLLSGLNAAPRYDGGLSSVRWQARNPLQQHMPQRERAYGFTYDSWGQLADAQYMARSVSTGVFDEEKYAYSEHAKYDENGNITSLSRRTQPTADNTTAYSIDKLTYRYDGGNRLLGVNDADDATKGFRDTQNAGGVDEYEYDANGNVTSDANKQVGYSYNILNKVAVQSSSTGGSILYDYDAAGTLLHRKVQNAGPDKDGEWYYVDGIEYEMSKRVTGLASIPTPEGRVVLVTGTRPQLPVIGSNPFPTSIPATGIEQPGEMPSGPGVIDTPAENPDAITPSRYVYEYHLRDHLDNLRVAFRAEATQRELHITMDDVASDNEEENYPYLTSALNPVVRESDPNKVMQGTTSAAATAQQSGPEVSLAVADGDKIKIDFFYRTYYGKQYSRPALAGAVPAAKLAALAPLVQLLPAPLATPTAGDGIAPNLRWQAGVQVGVAGLLSGWGRAARQQKRLLGLTQPGVMNGAGDTRPPLTEFPPYVYWELRDADDNRLGRGIVEVPVLSQDWEHFSTNIVVDASGVASRTGTLTVQLLNYGSLPVYFDSLTIRQSAPGVYISQEQHYYPFGMNMSGVAVNTQPAGAISKQQYNGGSELEDGLLDAESGNYSTPYRRYDPTIGRFLGVDPLADKYADYSPYNFALNDPANLNDPSGADALGDLVKGIASLYGGMETLYTSGGDGAGGQGEGGGKEGADGPGTPAATSNTGSNIISRNTGGANDTQSIDLNAKRTPSNALTGGTTPKPVQTHQQSVGFRGGNVVSPSSLGFGNAPAGGETNRNVRVFAGDKFETAMAQSDVRRGNLDGPGYQQVFDRLAADPAVALFSGFAVELLPIGAVVGKIFGSAAGRGTTVLGHYPEYVTLAESTGARTFKMPASVCKMSVAEQWAANAKFLDKVIARGDNIRLATPLSSIRPGSFLQRELNYLFERGYRISSDGRWLIK